MVLDELAAPVVLAPLAGGPSTPELAAAVSAAGGLGFVASGYLDAEETESRIRATRELSSRPMGVNVFAPVEGPAEPSAYGPYLERLRKSFGGGLGEPRFGDDDFEAKVALLAREPVAVVSFTFGCPPPAALDQLHAAGSEVWITVTTPAEARAAAAAGADALVVQGGEAGGHRGSFADRPGASVYGLLSLLQLLGAGSELPLVASGGIATGRGLAAAVAAGARAAQIGTAFMLCPEAGTSAAHREALASDGETALTRAFSGRLARGIRNRFLDEHSAAAPLAYPEVHHATAPLRAAARERGDASLINLWAGETHALARAESAGDVVRRLVAEARQASADANARLGAS